MVLLWIGFVALRLSMDQGAHSLKEYESETNFSTKQHQAQATSWLSCTHGDESGPSGDQETACERSKQTECLNHVFDNVERRFFPRTFRLTRAREFNCVFSKGLRSTGKELCVLARVNGLGEARIGMVIPRRRVRKAVSRNRIKRVIRESFRHHRQTLRNLDVVVLARTGLDETGKAKLRQLLIDHWHYVADGCGNPRPGRV